MNKIKCLICGKYFTKPCSHVWQAHQLSAREYKKEFGFDLKKGIIPEEHREHLKEVQTEEAKENLKKGSVSLFQKGDHSIGRYERSKQTLERLHVLHKFNKRTK